MNRNLGVAFFRTTRWVNRDHFGAIIIQILDRGRPHIILEGNLELHIANSGILRGNAMNFTCRNEFSLDCYAAKTTLDVFSLLKVRTLNHDFSASFFGPVSWLGVKEERRLIIVENIVIFGVLNAVKGDFNAGLVPVETGRSDTLTAS